MPRTCTVCSHPEKIEIDKALLAGEPFRNIAERSGTSSTALFRHKNDHIPLAMVMAQEAKEVEYGEDLFSQVKGLNARTLRILEQAEAAGDPRLALMAIREARSNAELSCRMIVQMEAVRPLEPSREEHAEMLERLNHALFGPGWKEEEAAREAAIRAGKPITCRECGRLYVKQILDVEPTAMKQLPSEIENMNRNHLFGRPQQSAIGSESTPRDGTSCVEPIPGETREAWLERMAGLAISASPDDADARS